MGTGSKKTSKRSSVLKRMRLLRQQKGLCHNNKSNNISPGTSQQLNEENESNAVSEIFEVSEIPEVYEVLEVFKLSEVSEVSEVFDAEMQDNTNINFEDVNLVSNPVCPAEITGRCIVNFGHVFAELQRLSNHWDKNCPFSDLVITKTTRHGLKTKFFVECRICRFQDHFFSEPTYDTKLDVNTSATCGTIITGIGYTQLKQLLAAIDIPCMANKTYLTCHDEVSVAFAAAAEEEMRMAGEREKELAIERGDIIDGIPHIPVITDGSWMKRSYRSGSYVSPSGTAIIIGYHTKKILFVNVRNKYCIVCARAEKLEIPAQEHTCYKNWESTQSSTSMESDIILEGFRRSIEMHGLIYSKYIGDGDSNVLKKLRETPPYPNVTVEKIECTNHLLRGLCNKIRDASNIGGRKISKLKKAVKNSVLKIRYAVLRSIIFRRSTDVSWQEKIAGLTKDLQNIPSHVFGEHKHCAALKYFCNGVPKEGEENLIPQLDAAGLLPRIQSAIKRLVDTADSLLHKYTSNCVESCNAVICKLIGGKRIHFSKKGSYQTRVKASVVQFNNLKAMTSACNMLGKQAPTHTTIFETNNIINREKSNVRLQAIKEVNHSNQKDYYLANTIKTEVDVKPKTEALDTDDNVQDVPFSNDQELLVGPPSKKRKMLQKHKSANF